MSNTNQNPAAASPAGSAGTLVEETPLGLTAEQMGKSNPEAVKSLQEEAKAEDRKRLTALQEAFKEDPNFAMQAFTDGLSVDAAKAKRYDAIAPKVADLEKQVTDLKAQVEGNKVNVTVSKEGSPTPAKTTDEVEAEALKIWEGDEDLRAEFGGEKSAFLAAFKHDPKEFRPKK